MLFDFKKNIYTLSAELGVPFGILLSIMAVAMIFADKVPPCALIATFIIFACPVVLYFFQRKRFVASDGFASFSELWILAIFTTIGGCLIMAMVYYLTISFIRPEALYEQLQFILDKNNNIDAETATTLQKMIDRGLLPSPLEFSIMQFWLFASLGCVGGAVTALIASKIPLKQRDNLNNNSEK